jgi:predicted RNA-binding protein YlqC (UPF0109 family)
MDDVLQQNNSEFGNQDNRPQITPEKLKDFVQFIISNIVNNKEEVDIAVVEDVPGSFTVHIKVAAEDKGRVIGREGNTINSLRKLVRVFGRILILIQE